MADVIQLLPDVIANQIAAGEVIQRPASVVKELLENAVDAGGTNIQLIVKEAGKLLVQVVDDGCGMSETDARMSFERHATSKIKEAKDLFAIRTMGFRGEALASVASVAQVEMRTRRAIDELGTRIVIEGSELKVQEPCQSTVGTNIAVRNLFFNVPARRNFLRSNTVEMRHINDEFQRVALAHPNISFIFRHNNTEVYRLPSGNLRQRIVNLFGAATNKKLVPVNEDTELVRILGYIGKPEYAKKTRGEQYFFVNSRFIKSGWLQHAVVGAFEDLLPKESYPSFFIFVDIDPASIDINVHPTKQEIKFDDDKMIYNYLKVAVRHALGKYSVTPTLDFDQDPIFANPTMPSKETVELAHLGSRANEKLTEEKSKQGTGKGNRSDEDLSRHRTNLDQWEKLYKGLDVFDDETSSTAPSGDSISVILESKISGNTAGAELDDAAKSFSKKQKRPYHLHGKYIVHPIKSGFWLIDQQAAHERILYERFLHTLQHGNASIQTSLFPQTIELSPADAALMNDSLSIINQLGFDMEAFGGNTFIVRGVPAELKESGSEQEIIESLLEQLKMNLDLKIDFLDSLARSLATSAAVKRGRGLSDLEMEALIDQLFACAMSFKSPSGRKCFITFELEELEKRFLD